MYKEIEGFTSPNDEDILYRYINFEKFVNILVTKSLFFTRADKFEDPFEGFVPQILTDHYKQTIRKVTPTELADILIKVSENSRKYVMCNCWHQNEEESMAMWGQYHMHNSGVVIKTTMQNLKHSLLDEIDFYIGKMTYLQGNTYDAQYLLNFLDTEFPADQLDKKWAYFPYFHKRRAFEYEREVRVTVDITRFVKDALEGHTPKTFLEIEFPDICDKGLSFNVDVDTLIDEVIVSPYAEPIFEDWVTETAKEVVRKYGYDFDVNRSTLLFDPTSNDSVSHK